MTPTYVRVRRPLFVPSRSCVCVSVGKVLRAYSSTPPARHRRDVLCMCKLYLYTLRSFRSALALDPEC